MERRHRLLLAEDHTILREGLRAIFVAEPDFEVAGEAADGREAVRCAEAERPDLVLLDLTMPHTSGLEALGEIKRVSPGTRVLVLTVHKTEEYVFAALEAGADGYVLKDASAEDLVAAVRTVLGGEQYLSPAVATKVVTGFLVGRGPGGARFDGLSAREREVLQLVAEGYRTREIANYLCISPKTVEKHRGRVMRKLDLHTVPALTAYALERGLIGR